MTDNSKSYNQRKTSKSNMNYGKLTTIAVTKENYAKLKELGRTGDSFNDVITRLLDLQK